MVTVIDHGGLTALNDSYVRALASALRQSDTILRRDYVPALPRHQSPRQPMTDLRVPGPSTG